MGPLPRRGTGPGSRLQGTARRHGMARVAKSITASLWICAYIPGSLLLARAVTLPIIFQGLATSQQRFMGTGYRWQRRFFFWHSSLPAVCPAARGFHAVCRSRYRDYFYQLDSLFTLALLHASIIRKFVYRPYRPRKITFLLG